MREPVVILIKGQLLFPGSVGFHPPDLHGTALAAVIINVFAVGRSLRSVYMGRFEKGQLNFRSALNRTFIDIIYCSIPLCHVQYGFVIRSPAMEVRRSFFGYQFWDTAGKGKNIYLGTASLRTVAYRQ